MANSLVNGDVVQVRIWCSDAEQASVNTVNYVISSVVGTITDQDLATYFDLHAGPLFIGVINSTADYDGVEVKILGRTPPLAAALDNTHAGPGTGETVALPRQTCGLISWKTNFAGQRFRGRLYLPFPSTAVDVAGGVPSAAYITAANLIAVLLPGLSPFTGVGGGTANGQMVLLHKEGKSVIPAPSPVDEGIVSTKWATQRRRGSFGRPNVSPF